jgi:peptidoglycan hydrolase FlgJ
MNINKTAPKIQSNDSAQAPGKTTDRDPKMLEAAKAFEGQFIRQLMSEMRKTVPDDPLVPESMADKIFREQLDNQYAESWVDQGGVGLADMIYGHLMERYGNQSGPMGQPSGHVFPLKLKTSNLPVAGDAFASRPQEILSQDDRNLFLIKKSSDGFSLKAKSELTDPVGLHAPLPGLVLQAAALEDGKQMVVVKHDQGLISKIVHSGDNHVKTGTRIGAGDVLARLSPGRVANVFFELRKAAKVE